MIVTSKNNSGHVIAYMEARVVGQSGFDKLDGDYLYIADLWIHQDYHNDWSVFRELMREAIASALSILFIYFQRRKYGGRQSMNYSKERILKLINKVPAMREVL